MNSEPVHLISPLNWYMHASGSDQAQFWVGFGTIFLAAVTLGVIVLTLRQSHAEHERFQQGYAPMLEADTEPGKIGTAFYLVQVSNLGYGPALKVTFRLTGSWIRKIYDDATPLRIDEKPHIVEERRIDLDIHRTHALVPLGSGAWQFDARANATDWAIDTENMSVDQAYLVYQDRFGNEYRTIYTDFLRGQYDWIRPLKFDPHREERHERK